MTRILVFACCSVQRGGLCLGMEILLVVVGGRLHVVPGLKLDCPTNPMPKVKRIPPCFLKHEQDPNGSTNRPSGKKAYGSLHDARVCVCPC